MMGGLAARLAAVHPEKRSDRRRSRSFADNPDGGMWLNVWKRLITVNAVIPYSIIQAPFPVVDYLSTIITVHETADSQVSRVEWFAEFTPVNVTNEERRGAAYRHLSGWVSRRQRTTLLPDAIDRRRNVRRLIINKTE